MAAARVSFLQFDAREGDRAGNLERVTEATAEARREGAALLVCPELWPSGYDLAAARAEGGWEREIAACEELSRVHEIAIVGSHLAPAPAESSDDRPTNCAIAHERGAVRARYEKVHLFGPLAEPKHIRAGNALPAPFDLAGLRVAMAVCYDLRFPEVFRPAAVAGVDLFIVCAQWPVPRIAHWRALLIARAIENQCFVLGVNRFGSFGQIEFGGNSLLVSPTGEVRAEAGDSSGLCFGEVDPREVREWRERFPVLGDRRVDLSSSSVQGSNP